MIFLGLDKKGGSGEIFHADAIPTFASHGGRYAAVIGPFRTLRGAAFMRDHGQGNPHCQTVADAEKISRACGGS